MATSLADDFKQSNPNEPSDDVEASDLNEPSNNVEVTRANSDADMGNVLSSVKTLRISTCPSEGICKGLLAMNFKKPSEVQEKALPLVLLDPPHNMIAQSQSGTGKAAAFVVVVPLQRMK